MCIPDVVATDTTNLQSAWSAAMPSYYSASEDRAVLAFQECVQRYVYHRRLFAPIPGKDAGATNPLMRLWFDQGDRSETADSSPLVSNAAAFELEETEERKMFAAFRSDFVEDTSSYRSWTAFQMSARVSDEYISRIQSSGRDPVEPIREAYDRVAKKIQRTFPDAAKSAVGSIPLSSWHLEQCKRYFSSSVSTYALCYAYSLFRRGRQYGIGLRGKGYAPHWSRIRAQYLPGIDAARRSADPFSGCTNWGRVIYELIKDGFIIRDSQHIIDLLRSVRGDVQSGDFDLHSDAQEDTIRILENARVYARYSRSPLYRRLSDVPRKILAPVPFVGKCIEPILTTITFLGSTHWIERIDARLTRMVMYDAYKKSFFVPGVVERQGALDAQPPSGTQTSDGSH